MPDILRMNQTAVLPAYEQKMRELEAVPGNAIALLTPNMLTLFANRVEKKKHYHMVLRQDDIKGNKLNCYQWLLDKLVITCI